MTPHSIFVAIAAYRDPQLEPTVRDLFLKARRPERIFVGICLQEGSTDPVRFHPPLREGQIRLARFDTSESQGCSWAKAKSLELREDEDFVLQVDSHTRFDAGWDDILIGMLSQCDSRKPLISTYPASFDLPPSGAGATIPAVTHLPLPYAPSTLRLAGPCVTPHIIGHGIDLDHGRVILIGDIRKLHAPLLGAFIAGGYVFSRPELYREVPFDPDAYFLGLEVSYSVRVWTHGWDPFTPHRCVLHHLYGRPEAKRHWCDHPNWYARELLGLRRMRHLLGTERSSDPDVVAGLDGRFGLGCVRSLSEYEEFSGVRFRSPSLTDRSWRGDFGGPAPVRACSCPDSCGFASLLSLPYSRPAQALPVRDGGTSNDVKSTTGVAPCPAAGSQPPA